MVNGGSQYARREASADHLAPEAGGGSEHQCASDLHRRSNMDEAAIENANEF